MKNKTKGYLIKVFEKPFTRESLEGEAELFRRVPSNRDDENVENWMVVFTSDGFKCERLINKEDLKYDVPFGYH